MKIILRLSAFVFGLFFLFANNVLAATYYVSPTGSNTAPYDTWDKAANLPSTAITAGNSVAGPHVLYIAPGTYVDRLTLSNLNWASSSVLGTHSVGSTDPATFGQVNIEPTTGVAITSGKINQTIEYVSATSPDNVVLRIESTGFYGKGLYLHDGYGLVVFPYVASSATLEYSKFLGSASTSIAFQSNSSNNVIINYCIFGDSATNRIGRGVGSSLNLIHQGGTGTLTISNTDILDSRANGVSLESAGSIDAYNNIIASGAQVINQYPIKRLNGNMNIYNSAVLGDVRYPASLRSGTITETSNLDNPKVSFVNYSRAAYVIPSVDDTSAAQYAESLSNELVARGQGGTFYAYVNSLDSNRSYIDNIINAGAMEVQGHSRSHDGLAHSGALYTITKTGETVNVDRALDTITVSNTGTVTGFKSKSLDDISAELVAMGVTVSALPSSYVRGISLGEIMADSGGPQPSPYVTQMLIDPTGDTGYLYSELVSAASELSSALGVTIDIVAPPYGDTNDTVKNVCQLKGFRACRAGTDWALDNIDLQNIIYFSVSDLLGSNDTETVSNVRTFANEVATVGGIVSILAHSTSEATMHDWGLILDTLKNEFPDISVTKMSTAINAVRDSGLWTTNDNRHYSRTWDDSSANFNLSWNSDLIDTGTSTSSSADFAGNPIYGNRDIGAYEYQPPFTLGTDKIDPTGNIRIYGDKKYRYTTATSSTMLANFSVSPAEGSWTYSASSSRPEWLNISNITWNTSGSYSKQWTASSSSATTTVYTVGDLLPDKSYLVSVDGAGTTTSTTDSSGILTYTYTGGYSTHTFGIEAAPTVESSPAPASSGTSVSSGSSMSPQARQEFLQKIYADNGLVCPPNLCPTQNTAIKNANTTNSNNGNYLNYTFSASLKKGNSSDDVRKLQILLNSIGYVVAKDGPGSPGNETDFFGSLTFSAVIKLQKDYGLPTTGYFGPMTRGTVSDILEGIKRVIAK